MLSKEDSRAFCTPVPTDTKSTKTSVSKQVDAMQFIQQVAGLSIWDYDDLNECERPGEGFLDSHCTLMALIKAARAIAPRCEDCQYDASGCIGPEMCVR